MIAKIKTTRNICRKKESVRPRTVSTEKNKIILKQLIQSQENNLGIYLQRETDRDIRISQEPVL